MHKIGAFLLDFMLKKLSNILHISLGIVKLFRYRVESTANNMKINMIYGTVMINAYLPIQILDLLAECRVAIARLHAVVVAADVAERRLKIAAAILDASAACFDGAFAGSVRTAGTKCRLHVQSVTQHYNKRKNR